MERYSEYKDSGVQWIGEIPSHWMTTQFQRLYQIKKDIAGKLGFDVLSVTQSGIKIKDVDSNQGQIAMDYSKYQLVDVDDFIMNHMDLITGYIDQSQFSGVTSPDYRVFKKNKEQIFDRYYLYIFHYIHAYQHYYLLHLHK